MRDACSITSLAFGSTDRWWDENFGVSSGKNILGRANSWNEAFPDMQAWPDPSQLIKHTLPGPIMARNIHWISRHRADLL